MTFTAATINPALSDNEAIPGLAIQANDTNPPTAGTFTPSNDGSYIATAGSDSETSISKRDIYDWNDGNPFRVLADVALTGVASTIPLVAGVARTLFMRYYDAATPTANYADSLNVTVTGTASAGGVISIKTAPTAVDEGTATTFTAQIVGRTASGDTYFKYTTTDHTCVDGTNYYGRYETDITGTMTRLDATYGNIPLTDIGDGRGTDVGDIVHISSTGGTYSTYYTGYVTVVAVDNDNIKFAWTETDGGSDPGVGNDDDGTAATVHTGVGLFPDGVNDDVVMSINTIDADMTKNRKFESYLEISTPTNSAALDLSTLNNYATLHPLNGTGAVGGGYAEYTSGTDQVVFLDSDMTEWQISSGAAHSDTWQTDDYTGVAALAGGPTNIYSGTSPANYWYDADANYNTNAPKLSIPVEISTAGAWRIWLLVNRQDANNNTLYGGFDGDNSIAGTTSYANYGQTVNTWAWEKVTTSFTLSAGTHQLDIYPREPFDEMWVARAALCDSATFTPTGTTDALSTLSVTGIIEDDTLNPSDPTGPSLTNTISTGYTLSPANGATDVQISAVPAIILENMSDPVITSATATADGDAVNVNLGVRQSGTDWLVEIAPTGFLSNSSVIAITNVVGTAIDTDGERKNLPSPTWSFTTIASAPRSPVRIRMPGVRTRRRTGRRVTFS